MVHKLPQYLPSADSSSADLKRDAESRFRNCHKFDGYRRFLVAIIPQALDILQTQCDKESQNILVVLDIVR